MPGDYIMRVSQERVKRARRKRCNDGDGFHGRKGAKQTAAAHLGAKKEPDLDLISGLRSINH